MDGVVRGADDSEEPAQGFTLGKDQIPRFRAAHCIRGYVPTSPSGL